MAPSLDSTEQVLGSDLATTSLVSSAVTVNNGDVLVVKTVCASQGTVIGTVTGGSQTWTTVASDSTTNRCPVKIQVCTVSGSPGTVTVTQPFTGTAQWRSMTVERWSNAQLAATPATNSVKTSSSTPGFSFTLTTVAANSVVTWVAGDWDANAAGTVAYLSSAIGEGIQHYNPGSYTTYQAYQTAAVAGSQTAGTTTPNNAVISWSFLGIEVQEAQSSIGLRAAGTSTAATDAVTAINPAVPTGTMTGDLSVLTVAMKPYSATITTPSGWTKIGEATNGTTVSGADTGSTKIAMFVRESAAVGAIGNLTLGGSPDSVGAVIHSYAKPVAASWDFAQFTTGGDAVNDANYSATGAAGILAVAGDWVVAGTAVNSDLGTVSAQAIGGMAGVTFAGTQVRTSGAASGSGLVTTGNDSRVIVTDQSITAGASNAPPTASYTNASSTSGTTLFLRLRARSTFAPPDAFVGGTIRTQQSGQTSSAVTVPTGTAAGQIAVVDFWVSPSGITPTAPTGFTLQSSVSLAASTRTATLFRYWKRLTAADTGSYTFTTASAQTMGICTLWSGRRTVGSPFDSAEQTNTAPSGVTTAVACPDVNITPNTGGVVLLYGVAVWSSGLAANTVSQSFGDAMRNGTNGQLVAFKNSQPASASGNVNTSGSDNWIEILSALLPATTDAGFSNNRRQAIRRAANW